jgi:hypothetical protein
LGNLQTITTIGSRFRPFVLGLAAMDWLEEALEGPVLIRLASGLAKQQLIRARLKQVEPHGVWIECDALDDWVRELVSPEISPVEMEGAVLYFFLPYSAVQWICAGRAGSPRPPGGSPRE